jgi:hypothetical protein
LMTGSSLGLLLLLALVCKPAAAGAEDDYPPVFRWDQVRILCTQNADCPTNAQCLAGICRYPCQTSADCASRWSGYSSTCAHNWCQATGHDVNPPTINYLAPSYNQIGGLCYLWSKLHSFQARVAIAVDRNGWYHWGVDDLDRSIPLTITPFWQCSAGDLMRFTEAAGLVDKCFDPTDEGRFEAGTCGFYERYMAPRQLISQEPCSAPQEAQSRVLSFRAGYWEELVPFTTYQELAELIYRDGPPAISVPDKGHNLSVIGYDFRTLPHHFCLQDSGSDGVPIRCEGVGTSDWTGFDMMDYPMGIQRPEPFDPVSLHPFDEWIQHDDKDGDGVPASTDTDQDGDEAYDIFDPLPFNPYLRIDADGDGYGEPRLSGRDELGREENCLAFCESLDLLTYLQAAHPSWQVPGANHGGQACRDKCLNWDKCTTVKIKNVGDAQCNWRCMSTRNKDPICDYDGTDTRASCCTLEEINNLETICAGIYANVSNVDSDGASQDPDQIADVCEEGPLVSGLELSLNTVSRVRADRVGPDEIQIAWLEVCRESAARVQFSLFGGTSWSESGDVRVFASHQNEVIRVGEVGSCGCYSSAGDWSACLGIGGACSEGEDWQPGDPGYQAWEDIEAPECRSIEWAYPHPDPEDALLCEDKRLVHGQDEDCTDGDCDLYELEWRWTQHGANGSTFTLPGETIKVRVGERLAAEPWQQNQLSVSANALTLPDPPVECWIPALDGLADWVYVEAPREPPREWPLGLGPRELGTWGLARDPVAHELYLFEFDRRMQGPFNHRRLTYGRDDVPRIEGNVAVVAAAVEAHLLDREREGSPLLFVLGHQMAGHRTEEPRLWVVDLEMGKIWLAEDLFGPSQISPPAMTSPVALYDSTNGQLLVAGGGEGRRFGIWAYAALTGQWRKIPTTLPKDLEAFGLAEDGMGHRLLLVGGMIRGAEQAQLLAVSQIDGRVTKAPKPPVELARTGVATAIDPWGRRLYLFGGRRGDRLYGDLWMLDLDNWAWTQLDDGLGSGSPGARERAHIFWERRHGRLWVTGGNDASGARLPTLWGYSPPSGEWEALPLGGTGVRVYLPLVLRSFGD